MSEWKRLEAAGETFFKRLRRRPSMLEGDFWEKLEEAVGDVVPPRVWNESWFVKAVLVAAELGKEQR